MNLGNQNVEKEFLLLSLLKNRTVEENDRLVELSSHEIDWGWIGGQIMHHRLSGYFYFGLGDLRKKLLFKEFLKAIDLIVKAQAQQVREINQIILPVLQELDDKGIRYAALKGLVFNASLYGLGERRSNDSDILVLEDDLERLDEVLRKHGYIQTFLHNGEYKEATRKEKMIQRMNYHDLVPYVKMVDSSFISYHEIDVNFHIDSKENDITREVFEIGTELYANDLYEVKGLPWETHLAQLCIHFFREGSSSLWSSGRRDVVLYKLIDIANTLRLNQSEERLAQWITLMKKLKLEKACYYTLHHVDQFYPQIISDQILQDAKPIDTAYLNEIAVSGEERTVTRQTSFRDEAFNLLF
ncbi:nucleotidyltransferase family protein [Candidatus Pristimantibacillus sp. PTI5]|uniref:nucleotidyltransferase family protein n=1 Tax=Candidatus Pristimantibacillus sp. PTI5 TaxID=3400422 RepID=UPI003B02730B